MSQNYKIIREFKEVAEALMKEGMKQSEITKQSGIAHARIHEIMNYDPVSVNIRVETIEKLQTFIAEHKNEEKKEQPIMPTLNREGLLGELSKLINDFQAIGYKLDVNISLIYKP